MATPALKDVARLSLLLLFVGLPAANAAAQIPSDVRVVNASPLRRWFPNPESDVLMVAQPGTLLEVLDQESGWYWIVAPRDAFGTAKSGWVRVKDVEAVPRAVARPAPAAPRAPEPTATSSAPSGASALASGVSVSNGPAPVESTTLPKKDYTFEDVHFALNRASVRAEDEAILDGAAEALKNDPMLRMNIEGYTCNLGKPAYNLLLGDRRANAVKDYLIGKGVPADRLRTKSFGEENPKHDNSTEETRKLNRRVALVPSVEP
jgi:outer membrane protein OmpA-like peptidoglycan-associated protein